MADLEQIAAALAAQVGTIGGLQASPYVLASPTLPCVEVIPGDIDYDQAMARGHDTNMFTVRVCVAETSDVGSQKQLYRFLQPSGATSVKAALEEDRTLGGLAQYVQVRSCSGFRRAVMEGRGAIVAADWTVEVAA